MNFGPNPHGREAAGGLLRGGSPRRTALLIAAAALLSVGCNRPEQPKQGPDSQPSLDAPAIVFLGDSLTAGRGLLPEESMPALVQKRIAAEGWKLRVINAGRSGDTTAGGLARLDWYLQKRNNVVGVVIGLGSNDSMRGQPIASMRKNLETIVERIRAFDPQIQIFLFQMHTFPNLGKRYAESYEQMFQQVARSKKIVLLPFPLRGVGGVARLNQPDGIHPTAEGTRLFAENVWKPLRPHLAKIAGGR